MMLVLAEDSTLFGNLLMAGAVVLLTTLVLVNLRKRNRQATSQRLDPREKLERMRQTTGMKDDMRQMMVELEELTRRFSAQLDAKSLRIERLLEEAEEKIEELKRAAGSGNGEMPGHGAADQQSTEGDAEDDADAPNGSPPTVATTARASRPPRVMGGSRRANGSSEPDASDDAEPSQAVDGLSRKVFDLADSGRSPIEIARDLDEQVGKVELILALRQHG